MREKTHILLTVFLMSVLSLTLASPGLVQLQPLDEQLCALCSDRNSSASDIKSLIDSGADVNAENPRGLSPLMLAARYHRDERVIIVLLASGAQLEAKSHSGQTALMLGSTNQNVEVVLALLDAGADYTVRGPRFDETPLMNAAQDNPNPEIVKAFLKAGASLEAVNKDDMNALDHAAKENQNPDVIRLLIEEDADIDRKNKFGMTPLMWAAGYNSNPDVVLLLLKLGSNPHIRNARGQTALDLLKLNPNLRGTEAQKTLQNIPPEPEPEHEPANDPAPELDISTPLPTQPGSSTSPASTKRYRYAFIPLHGGFGEELHADVLDATLKYLKHRKCDCVIFDINSGGGFVAEQNMNGILTEQKMIVDVMQKHAENFVYVAVIKNALNAAVLPAINCNHIFLEEGGTVGATETYSTSLKNSAIAADHASTAAANGWNPLIIRPMIVMKEALYCWDDAQGNLVIDKQKPTDSSIPFHCIDDENNVLTLSSDHAALLGFPTLIPKRQFGGYQQDAIPSRWKAHMKLVVSHIADHVNSNQKWGPCRGDGHGSMSFKKAAGAWAEAKINFERRAGLQRSINHNINNAQASDPERQTYSFTTIPYFYTTRRVPTTASWNKWRAATDRSTILWETVIDEIEELFAIEELCDYYYESHTQGIDELQNRVVLARSQISRLRQNRSAGPQQ